MAVCLRISILGMLLSVVSAATHHMAPAPAASVDCSSVVLSMADCLSYVTAGGTARKPEGNCCSGLKTVVKTNPDCLCEAFKNSAQLGVTLNMTKALGLPAACHVSAPSVSNCGLSAVTGAAPALSPTAASPSYVAGAPIAGIGGNEGAPAPATGASGSSMLATSIGMLVFTTVAAIVSLAMH